MENIISIIKGIHPGIFLERELKKRKIKKGKFALSLQAYPQTLVSITKGNRKMNIPLAMKIEEKLNLEEGFLMTLQLYYDIEIEKSKQNILIPDLTKIRPAIFWDTDFQKINWQKQKKAVLERVLERGNDLEKNEIMKFYGIEK
jgi:antitoxin HigA-1